MTDVGRSVPGSIVTIRVFVVDEEAGPIWEGQLSRFPARGQTTDRRLRANKDGGPLVPLSLPATRLWVLRAFVLAALIVAGLYVGGGQGWAGANPRVAPTSTYPSHTGIVATTFWVGEIFDPNASDGSQVISTYDSSWMVHYGGCDGVTSSGGCDTEKRLAPTFFPLHMKPKQNPFYLDLPFDDLNNAAAFKQRCRVVPWANAIGYAGHCTDQEFSYMKNRWVKLTGTAGQVCYGQIEDAGPGRYNDSAYVFGTNNARPANRRYGGAGMDVSPALNGCLGMKELDGDTDRLSWRFVDASAVTPGPWTNLVTTSGVLNQ